MNDSGVFDLDEDEDRDATATWAEFQLFKVPDDAPARSVIHSAFDEAIIRAGVTYKQSFPMEGSSRWSVVQRFVTPVVDEDGDIAFWKCPKVGQIVLWRERHDDDGPEDLSAPSLVVHTDFFEEDGEHVVFCLTDSALPAVPVDAVPFPMHSVIKDGPFRPVSGWVRRYLWDLWSLELPCVRCAPAVNNDDYGGGTPTVVDDPQYWCADCTAAWRTHTAADVLPEHQGLSDVPHWAVHLLQALSPLAEAGWQRDPVELEWTRRDGLLVTVRHTRRDEMLVAYYDPADYQIALFGPVEFGVCRYVDSREGADAVEKLINECAPWILSDFTQMRLPLFEPVVNFTE